MNINIEMPNLDGMIKEITEENIHNTINKVISDKVDKYLGDKLQNLIEESVVNAVDRYVVEFIKTYTVKLGGGLTGGDIKEVTVEDYIKEKIAESLEKQVFTIEEKDNWGDIRKKTVSFDTYVKTHFNINKEIESYLSKYVQKVQYQLTADIKKTFDDCTKEALSKTVFDMLMKTDTYQKINTSIQMLGQNN